MKDAEDEYRSYLEYLDIHQQPLSIPLASTVSGKVIPIGESLNVEHWVKQVTAPVLFSDALVKVLNVDEYKLDLNIKHSSKVGVVIEIGPSTVLSRMAKSWREHSISKTSRGTRTDVLNCISWFLKYYLKTVSKVR